MSAHTGVHLHEGRTVTVSAWPKYPEHSGAIDIELCDDTSTYTLSIYCEADPLFLQRFRAQVVSAIDGLLQGGER